jgi:hypothetical protein
MQINFFNTLKTTIRGAIDIGAILLTKRNDVSNQEYRDSTYNLLWRYVKNYH